MQIEKSTLQFFYDIKAHNTKEWFEANRPYYNKARQNLKEFMAALEKRMNQIDVIENHKLSRINRDLRFSKDKTPYKDYFWGYLRRFGNKRRGGYIISLETDKPSEVGGGFYSPNKKDLYRIRKEFEMDAQPMRKILAHKKFAQAFGKMQGNAVKTAPRGFDRNHPNIDLIRHKQFYFVQEFSDEEVLAPNFLDQVVDCYQTIRPFFDYMTEVLTTNLNGEPIV